MMDGEKNTRRKMTVLGMPDPTFVVFIATILAGSIGGIHYVLTYVVLGKSVESRNQDNTPKTANPEKERIVDGGNN